MIEYPAATVHGVRVLYGPPPVLDRVAAAFGDRVRSAFFAYEGAIYSPSGREPSAELAKHEQEHFGQQEAVGGAEAWWDRYLVDEIFRLEQEAEAYAAWLRMIPRTRRRRELASLAWMLADPEFYGLRISVEQAERAILRYMRKR